MRPPTLSICLDDLRMEIRPALDAARRIGFRTIDVAAATGPISPGELTGTGRRHFVKHLADLGLALGSLRAPAGQSINASGLDTEQRIHQTIGIIDLAAQLRAPVVSAQLGHLVRDDGAATDRLTEALKILADRADRAGVTLAIETSGMDCDALAAMIRGIDCPALGVSCDAGAMLMRGETPHDLADQLAGLIRLARARDAVRGRTEQPGAEVPMGQGELDPPRFLASLNEAGFSGDIVLTRQGSAAPAQELTEARRIFEGFIQGR